MRLATTKNRSSVSKNHSGLSYSCIYKTPRIDQPVTQSQLLRKAWVVTGNSMKIAIRNYSAHVGQIEQRRTITPKPASR